MGLMDNCWLYAGFINEKGYGILSLWINGRVSTRKVHRLMYECLKGAIPEGMELDHLCRERSCINPHHLEPVLHKVNCQRGIGSKTHCAQGHEFTPENTYYYAQRVCKTCAKERKLRYRQLWV